VLLITCCYTAHSRGFCQARCHSGNLPHAEFEQTPTQTPYNVQSRDVHPQIHRITLVTPLTPLRGFLASGAPLYSKLCLRTVLAKAMSMSASSTTCKAKWSTCQRMAAKLCLAPEASKNVLQRPTKRPFLIQNCSLLGEWVDEVTCDGTSFPTKALLNIAQAS